MWKTEENAYKITVKDLIKFAKKCIIKKIIIACGKFMKEKYHIVTYGCQMNLHESEKIAGILRRLNYENTDRVEDADIIVFNTCCIRENAENHAFGNIGALKKLKKSKPNLLIAVGGCMTQEKGKTEVLAKNSRLSTLCSAR